MRPLPVETEQVEPESWLPEVEELTGSGARFLALYGVNRYGTPEVRALFARGARLHLLSTASPDGALDSLVKVIPACGWDEREAHDQFGIEFRGHEPLRSLSAHTDSLREWTTDVLGGGVHEVAVGPIHAGIIESGHFRFHVVGEEIVHLDPKLFYKHRGLERGAEGATLKRGLAFAGRACGACAVANSLAYAQACEAALDLAPDENLRRARTLLLELERLYNHLHDLGAVCQGVGFMPAAAAFSALEERAKRLNAGIGAHRFLFGTVAIGESTLELSEELAAALGREIAEICAEAGAVAREVDFSAGVRDRFTGVGVLSRSDAERLGAVGPAARASGLSLDARNVDPGPLHYPQFTPASPHAPTGDVAARVEIRAVELGQTRGILEQLLTEPLDPGRVLENDSATVPENASVGVGRVESPRGETVCIVETAGRTVTRLHIRTASYANWPALAHTVTGNLLPDFPLINKSFELCYACVDR